jgi:NAD(P)H-dependent FMN reductase
VLTICGSLQRSSSNRRALEVVRAELEGLGVEVAASPELGLVPAFDPDREATPAVDELRARIAGCDAVVIATPEYAGGIAGALKNALDWIVGSGELYGKPVAVVSAGTSGGVHARRDLVRTLTWQGGHVVAALGISAPRTKADDTGRYTDRDTIDALELLARAVAEAPHWSATERLEHVTEITTRSGVEPGHIAPVPERRR